jgi:hypothetical protein
VDANLMGAAGLDRNPEQRDPGDVARPGHAGDRRSGATGTCRNSLSMDRIATDGDVDTLALMDHSPDQGNVFLLDFAVVKLPRQFLMGGIVLGHDHHPGCALVETVDDSRPQLAADPAEVGHVVQERVDQRSAAVSRPWMNYHAGRLVDDDQVPILEHDIERNVLGARSRRDWLGQGDGDDIAFSHRGVGLDRLDASERDVPLFNQPLNLGPRLPGDFAGQHAIEPVPIVLRLDGNYHRSRCTHGVHEVHEGHEAHEGQEGSKNLIFVIFVSIVIAVPIVTFVFTRIGACAVVLVTRPAGVTGGLDTRA